LMIGPLFCRNMFPENLVQACFQSMQTYYVAKQSEADETQNETLLTTLAPLMTTAFNESNVTLAKPVEIFERRLRYIDGMNVLGRLYTTLDSPFCTLRSTRQICNR